MSYTIYGVALKHRTVVRNFLEQFATTRFFGASQIYRRSLAPFPFYFGLTAFGLDTLFVS